jgi:thioredoxin-related protein
MARMKKISWLIMSVLTALIVLSFKQAPRPVAEAEGIKWMTLKEVQEAQKKEPRKVFIDAYTDWCGWCKRMDATTFSNPEIVKYVNQNFYAVKFNAESRETILFKGKEYKYVSQGMRGYNELAAEMLNGQMSYPTSIYFDEALNQIFPVPGYQDPKMFESVLNFVASNSYKTSTWEKYQAAFKGKVQ